MAKRKRSYSDSSRDRDRKKSRKKSVSSSSSSSSSFYSKKDYSSSEDYKQKNKKRRSRSRSRHSDKKTKKEEISNLNNKNLDIINELTPKIKKDEDAVNNLESNLQDNNFNGIELRSRVITQEENTNAVNSLELFSNFKKINYLEIPNFHRKL